MVAFTVAVEGITDLGAVRRLLGEVGASVELMVGGKGKQHLLRQVPNYNAAATYSGWFVLVDLDNDFECAVDGKATWLPQPTQRMCFRIAVREIEAWLLADRAQIARFLGVSQDLVPLAPDTLSDPKETVVNLARRSSRRDVRLGLVPRDGSGASVGPTYASDLAHFAEELWSPREAAQNSPSLERCLIALADAVNRERAAGMP